MGHNIHPRLLDVFDAKCPSDITSFVYEHMLQTCETMKADKAKAIDNCVLTLFFVFAKSALEAGKMGLQDVHLFKNLLRMFSAFKNWPRPKSDFPPSAETESCAWP